MKRKIEIEDNLDEIVEDTIEEVKNLLLRYLEDNPDEEDLPDLYNDLDYDGSVHEIIDGAVPIYDKEIDDLFYLYGDLFERAFENAGIGDKTDEGFPNGWKPGAIYCYIEDEVNKWWFNDAEDIFEAWKAEHSGDICSICGGSFEKGSLTAISEDDFDLVCEDCLKEEENV